MLSQTTAAATVPKVPGAFGAYPLPNPLLIKEATREDMRPQVCHVRHDNTRRMIDHATFVAFTNETSFENFRKVKSASELFRERTRFLFSRREGFSKLVC
jgi:hypothetical protein